MRPFRQDVALRLPRRLGFADEPLHLPSWLLARRAAHAAAARVQHAAARPAAVARKVPEPDAARAAGRRAAGVDAGAKEDDRGARAQPRLFAPARRPPPFCSAAGEPKARFL